MFIKSKTYLQLYLVGRTRENPVPDPLAVKHLDTCFHYFQVKLQSFHYFQVEMAHKVLSKDMSELVHAMKLVQKYLNTTVEGNYHK